MREIQQYKDDLIGISDDGPLGFSEGTYIVCAQTAGWAIFYSQGELLVSGYRGLQSIADRATALESVKKLIDQERLDIARKEADYHSQKASSELAVREKLALQEPQLYRAGDITIPLELLLSLHNALPLGNPARSAAIAYIETSAEKPKAHWTRGIRKLANGDLCFSNAAYTTAVNRGKQDTHTKGVVELFAKLSRELEFVQSLRTEELAASSFMAGEPGEPLVELRECDTQVIQLRERLMAMQSQLNQTDETTQITAVLGCSFEP